MFRKSTLSPFIYILQVKSPEEFALLVCSHFLYTYTHVVEASVHVEEYPWERLQFDDHDHNHAFIFSPRAYRFCKVTQKRNGELSCNH
jgi:urate oxidase